MMTPVQCSKSWEKSRCNQWTTDKNHANLAID
jgi:hypothetical protein